MHTNQEDITNLAEARERKEYLIKLLFMASTALERQKTKKQRGHYPLVKQLTQTNQSWFSLQESRLESRTTQGLEHTMSAISGGTEAGFKKLRIISLFEARKLG
jgi:hypothetical protein